MKARTGSSVALYRLGQKIARLVDRHVKRGDTHAAALSRAADEVSHAVADARWAVYYAEVVDSIARAGGQTPEEAIRADPPYLQLQLLLKLYNCHKERRRSALDSLAWGEEPFDPALAWKAPPFDMPDYPTALGRIAESVALIGRAADALKEAPPADWPGTVDLGPMCNHLAAARTFSAATRIALLDCGTFVVRQRRV